MMTPSLRKFVVTMHVIFSVGWLGAVVAFLALAIATLVTKNGATLHATYPAMELIVWWVIIPCVAGSLLSGLVTSLFTPWGLFRYYWVVVKLLINVLCCIVLVEYLRSMIANASTSGESVAHSAGALMFLVVATFLSVYKPRGLTRYGWRKQREQRRGAGARQTREIDPARSDEGVPAAI